MPDYPAKSRIPDSASVVTGLFYSQNSTIRAQELVKWPGYRQSGESPVELHLTMTIVADNAAPSACIDTLNK